MSVLTVLSRHRFSPSGRLAPLREDLVMKMLAIALGRLALGAGATSATSAAASTAGRVPVGQPVLPDGKCAPQEWSDAREVPLSEGARLSVKQAGDFVFLCIHFPRPAFSGLDLYLAPADGKLYN